MEFFWIFPVKNSIFAPNLIFLTKCPFPRLISLKAPFWFTSPTYILSHSIIFTIFFIGRYPKKPFSSEALTSLICPKSLISNQMFLFETVFPKSPILLQILYFYPRISFGHPIFPNLRSQFGLESPIFTQKSNLPHPFPLKALYSPKVSLQISAQMSLFHIHFL